MEKNSILLNLQQVLNAIPVGIVLSPSRKGGEIFCNDHFFTITKINPHVLHNSNSLNNLFRIAGINESDLNRILKGISGKDEHQDSICCKCGKSVRWLKIKVTKLPDVGGKKVYCWVFEDITLGKELLEKIKIIEKEIEERERLRIANDLHDGIGQILTAINLHVQSLENEFKPQANGSQNSISIISDLVRKAIAETKIVANNLIPDVLELNGLERAIEILINDAKLVNKNVDIKFSCKLINQKIEKKVELGIYRVSQEIINNFLKHSKATNFTFSIFLKSNVITVCAKDNGVGFDTDLMGSKKLGLNGMYERIKGLGGQLRIESKKGNGVKTTVEIPIGKLN